MASEKKEQFNIKSATRLNKLFRKVTRNINSIDFDGVTVELLDIHIHPDGIGSSLNYHEHSFIEIHVVESGAGKVVINNKEYHFTKGDFTVNLPGQVHYWEVTKRPLVMHIWWIRIPENSNQNTSETLHLFHNLLNASKVIYKLPHAFESSYYNMLRELKKKELCFYFLIKAYIAEILILLARATLKKKEIKSFDILANENDLEDGTIVRINQFLNDNITNPLMLDEIARNAAMSRRSVTRHYKKVTGISIGDKLSELRMYKAEQLLRETDLPIKTVAFNCGIPDVRYLCRKFRKFFKSSPSEFRSRLVYTDRRPPFQSKR